MDLIPPINSGYGDFDQALPTPDEKKALPSMEERLQNRIDNPVEPEVESGDKIFRGAVKGLLDQESGKVIENLETIKEQVVEQVKEEVVERCLSFNEYWEKCGRPRNEADLKYLTKVNNSGKIYDLTHNPKKRKQLDDLMAVFRQLRIYDDISVNDSVSGYSVPTLHEIEKDMKYLTTPKGDVSNYFAKEVASKLDAFNRNRMTRLTREIHKGNSTSERFSKYIANPEESPEVVGARRSFDSRIEVMKRNAEEIKRAIDGYKGTLTPSLLIFTIMDELGISRFDISPDFEDRLWEMHQPLEIQNSYAKRYEIREHEKANLANLQRPDQSLMDLNEKRALKGLDLISPDEYQRLLDNQTRGLM